MNDDTMDNNSDDINKLMKERTIDILLLRNDYVQCCWTLCYLMYMCDPD